METINTLNFSKDSIPTSDTSTSSSLSSSITEKSGLSESSNYSFSSVSSDDHFSQELTVSLQNLINQGEQREDWPCDLSVNSRANTMTMGNNEFSYFLTQQFSDQLPPPPPEFDVSPSDDRILSVKEFDSIFESFYAAADGYDNCRMVFRDNDDPMFDEQLTQALESFSIIGL